MKYLIAASSPTPDIRRDRGNSLKIFGVLFAFFACLLPTPVKAGFDLLVSSMANNRILRFNGRTGAFKNTLVPVGSGLSFPVGLTLGTDENIYVSSSLNDRVLRFDADSGAPQGNFASGGGLDFPQAVAFGADGDLYVGDRNTVRRYDGVSGAPLGPFISGTPALPNDIGAYGLVFGPDGNLYVSSFGNNLVLRYNGTTGVFIDIFASGNGMDSPYGLTFGGDGNLYVVSGGNYKVLRFAGQSGAFLDVFVDFPLGGLVTPVGAAFGPDGALYVSSFNSHSIMKYDATSGALIGPFVLPLSGGLSGPAYFIFRHICSEGDLNSDNSVDANDVPIFVDTLLGFDTDDIHIDEADLSCDGLVNGLDIAPFVHALLGD